MVKVSPHLKKKNTQKKNTQKNHTKKTTIGILTMVFYTSGPNLVIPAWTGDELSRGQAHDYCTHRRADGHRQTDTGNDNSRRPKLA